ncbi:unnamed protein product, partial [Nesidiocoris tenuis]
MFSFDICSTFSFIFSISSDNKLSLGTTSCLKSKASSTSLYPFAAANAKSANSSTSLTVLRLTLAAENQRRSASFFRWHIRKFARLIFVAHEPHSYFVTHLFHHGWTSRIFYLQLRVRF